MRTTKIGISHESRAREPEGERKVLAEIVRTQVSRRNMDLSGADLMRVAHDPLLVAAYLDRVSMEQEEIHAPVHELHSDLRCRLGTAGVAFGVNGSDGTGRTESRFVYCDRPSTSLFPEAFYAGKGDRDSAIDSDGNQMKQMKSGRTGQSLGWGLFFRRWHTPWK